MENDRHAFRPFIDSASSGEPVRTAVCHPCSEVALQGAVETATSRIASTIDAAAVRLASSAIAVLVAHARRKGLGKAVRA